MHSSPAGEYRFSEQIGHLLRRAYQRHVAIFRETVPDSQLTAAQFVVLCAVGAHESREVHDIVHETALDEPSVRGIVERLKWRKLVEVSHEPGDARQMQVTLTDAGKELIERTVPFAKQISENTFGDLTASERAALLDLLRKISMGNPGEAE